MPNVASQFREAVQDRYRIQRELGRGGMAVVYLADDAKHGSRVVVGSWRAAIEP